jgi:hypothetical protein
MNQRSTPDPLRIGGRPVWNWLSSPGAHAVAALLLLLIVVLVAVSDGAVPATAVRFLSIIAITVVGAVGLRLGVGPRAWGEGWFIFLESARVLELQPVPYWNGEIDEAERLRLQANALKSMGFVPLAFAIAGPLLIAGLVTLAGYGLPKETARIEMQQGEPVEFLVSDDGQRRRIQGTLRLDSVEESDSGYTAVLTATNLAGSEVLTTRLVEGERANVSSWVVQLASVQPSSLVGDAQIEFAGESIRVVRGTPSSTDFGTIELLDGRFSFLGQLGPAVLVRQVLATGESIDEWIFERSDMLHERLGAGPGAIRLQQLRPSLGITLNASNSGLLSLPTWLGWLGLALAVLMFISLALGGVWLRGREGDYELVAWGLPSRRARLMHVSRGALGVPAENEVPAGTLQFLILPACLLLATAVLALAPPNRAFVFLPMLVGAIVVAATARAKVAPALSLVAASVILAAVFLLGGATGAAPIQPWVAVSVGALVAAAAAAALLCVVSELGESTWRAAGLTAGVAGPVLLLAQPGLFTLGSAQGQVRQLSTWASTESLQIFAQTFDGPVASLAWPLVAFGVLVSLVLLVVPSAASRFLVWAVVGTGVAAAAAARSASGSVDSLVAGAPEAASLQLVDRFWSAGVDASSVLVDPLAPWAILGLATGVFVAWPDSSAGRPARPGISLAIVPVLISGLACCSLMVYQTGFRLPASGVGLLTLSVFACSSSVLMMHARSLRRPGLASACALLSLLAAICWSVLV